MFLNPPRRSVKTLIRTVLRGSAGRRARLQATRHHDERSPVAKYSRGLQTGLSAANRVDLIAGYVARVSVKAGLTLLEVAAKLGTGKDAVRCAVLVRGGTNRSRGRIRETEFWLSEEVCPLFPVRATHPRKTWGSPRRTPSATRWIPASTPRAAARSSIY